MKPTIAALATVILALSWHSERAGAEEGPASQVAFRHGDGQVLVTIGGEPFAKYVYRDREITRPYLARVRLPGGPQVTRNHPPQAGDAQDHATFHPGIWLAFGDINGHDYWRLKAKVVHDGFVEPPGNGSSPVLSVRNRYLSTDGAATICRELCRLRFLVRPQGVLIDWQSTLESAGGELVFGDQEEMGLGVRLATPISVAAKQGGRILAAGGRLNESGIWGQRSAWCDYSGPLAGKYVGVLLAPSTENARPAWWHVRDYGLMVANSFGARSTRGDQPAKLTLPPGESLTLRYAVLIHSSPDAASFDAEAAYRDCLEALKQQR